MSKYITGTYLSGYGLSAPSLNPVTVGSSAYITNHNAGPFLGDAIYGNTAAAWNILNLGTVVANAGTLSAGIRLEAGGTVTNAAGKLISGYGYGVLIGGSTGTVSNAGSAVIRSYYFGVALESGAGTVTNSGTIEAIRATGVGVFLDTGATAAGITNAPGGLVSGGFDGVKVYANAATATNAGVIEATAYKGAGVALLGTAGSVSNFGTIAGGTGGHSYGVFLESGAGAARVSNAAGALISGQLTGVDLQGAAGVLTNSGTIRGTGSGTLGAGVYMKSGGNVVNNATALLYGYADGVYIKTTTANFGTVTNLGSIEGGDGTHSDGIFLTAGTVVNGAAGAASAMITGQRSGVDLYGSAGVVINFATIQATGAGTLGAGAFLLGGGTVVNNASALLAGSVDGALVSGAAGGDSGTVTNLGTIEATATGADGVDLAAYGIVANLASGMIAGPVNGVLIGGTGGGSGTVTNYGTVEGSGINSDGAHLAVGGLVSNASSGIVSGLLNGIEIDAVAGTLVNSGAVAGTGTDSSGVNMLAGGLVRNNGGLVSGRYLGVDLGDAAIVDNYGTIASTATTQTSNYHPAGALLKGGTVRNGAANATGALISGDYNGILIGAGTGGSSGTVTNYGTVEGNGANSDGAHLAVGGFVSNASSGIVSGLLNGIEIDTVAGTLVDSGAVTGTGTDSSGVNMLAGGLVRNNGGVVSGRYLGVDLGDAAIVDNYGTIASTATTQTSTYRPAGVLIKGGTVRNGATNSTGALISGDYNGILIGAGTGGSSGTVTNYGTVEGNGVNSDGAHLAVGGFVSNASSGIVSGLLNGIEIDTVAGTLVNSGAVTGTGTDSSGVNMLAGGLVHNTAGSISGQFVGVDLGGSGIVVNYLGGTIAGSAYGIRIKGAGAVTNSGVVTTGSAGVGISLYAGSVTNFGTIVAPSSSAVVVRYGTFINDGVVTGLGFGIELGAAGTSGTASGPVTIASGVVSGEVGIGAASGIAAGFTVAVAGTVVSTVGTAGTAVSLAGGTSRLVVDPGAAFTGNIDGGGGSSVLEIAAAGSGAGGSGPGGAQGGVAVVSLGSVANFSALQIDPSATLDSSGALSFATLVNQGEVVVASGDSLAVETVASATTTGAIDLRAGATIHFAGPVAADQTLIFNPAGGTAVIDETAAFAATVADFTSILDTIDLTGLAFSGTTSVGFNSATNVLTVTAGGASATLQLDSETYSGISWVAQSNGGTGTDITVACFCRGTRILTARGEVPVEDLAIGERVVTLSGEARPIKWIGHRSYDGRFAFGQRQILPVCIKAGALADGVPRRDLWVSPNHALYLEGVLIEVRDLVNGVSIVQAERVAAVQYFHIELDSHDVLIAEGAAAESFLDDDNRLLFHNAPEYPALYPEAAAGPARYGAPRRDQGWEVERARAMIARRAGFAAPAEVPASGPLRGRIEEAGHRRICGWAQDTAHPQAPVVSRRPGRRLGRRAARRPRNASAS